MGTNVAGNVGIPVANMTEACEWFRPPTRKLKPNPELPSACSSRGVKMDHVGARILLEVPWGGKDRLLSYPRETEASGNES